MSEFTQAPSVLAFDRIVRVYFACRPPRDANGNCVSYSAYVDLDRQNLFNVVSISQQPLLQLGDLGTFDEFGTYFTSVIRRPTDVLAYYVGYTRCESVPFNIAIGAAISRDDGSTFTRLGPGPLLPYSTHEPFFLTVPKVTCFGASYYMWYSAGKRWLANSGRPEPVYRIRMGTSTDGVHWNRDARDLIPTRVDANECQACPTVIRRGSTYHMFFCYRYGVGYRSKERGYRIGYARSHDMVNWTRDDSKPGIDISDTGWDSEMISFPHVFELDGQTYMLYLGNEFGRCGFGLARLDGTL